MNFVFENLLTYENFVNCPDLNSSGIRRFTPSPVVTTLIRHYNTKHQSLGFKNYTINVSNNPSNFEKYIIASGVCHSPNDWCGTPVNNEGTGGRKNLFDYLNDLYLEDLRSGKAFLLLDQTHEGYHTDWLYEWFHASCVHYKISPNQIIYLTGNLNAVTQYSEWIKTTDYIGKLFIVPHAHFESMVYETSINLVRIHKQKPLPSFNDQLEYKLANLKNIKTYNALQKRPRAHRIWFFKAILEADLMHCGINSMNVFEHNKSYYMGKFLSNDDFEIMTKYLPLMPPGDSEVEKFQDQDCGHYLTLFNEQIMLDTWLSVVSEASFGEETCFLSEKTFKPIACFHPFIIYGNKHSLSILKEMGYQTFSPYINENYDNYDTWDRLDAIISSIKEFNAKSEKDKLEAFVSMKDILHHNHSTLAKNSNGFISHLIEVLEEYSQHI